eukprot:TRINITY_DN47777_c0_g1_i1.p1 TRINITY_DN47777_c0_g1~~TRINITY_DN47777_c0_g1_i1.p1  ORF type:complete len:276 (-),score=26.66 TRINITY_DN47777_c0_g1_i1:129-956(-)
MTSAPVGGSSVDVKQVLRRQLAKTKLCDNYKNGNCTYGRRCTFAHSEEELQRVPDLTKTRLCIAYSKGACDKPNCNFAHGEQELRSTDLFYKTSICQYWEKGECQAAEKCRFAHGPSDLRTEADNAQPPRMVLSMGSRGHPESCGQVCANFWGPRGCPRGEHCDRCHRCAWLERNDTEGSWETPGQSSAGYPGASSSDANPWAAWQQQMQSAWGPYGAYNAQAMAAWAAYAAYAMPGMPGFGRSSGSKRRRRRSESSESSSSSSAGSPDAQRPRR